jgi:acyl carrier protein
VLPAYTPLFDRVRDLAADVFSVHRERIRPESSPDDIENWDSLRHLNLVLALEQEFKIEFTPEEIEQLLSIELIVALVSEKTPVNGSAA